MDMCTYISNTYIVYKYIYTHTYTHIYVYTCTHTYIPTYIYIYIHQNLTYLNPSLNSGINLHIEQTYFERKSKNKTSLETQERTHWYI